jgi:hypothetical protein
MVRLLTVVGHGIELLPHFIQHYRGMVDEINIIVYSSEIYPNLKKEVQIIIEKYSNVKIIHSEKWRVFDWEHVTKLYNKFKFKYPDDWWIIADIDEFQLYSKSIESIINECDTNGWEFVTGGFIDRIGIKGSFPEIYEYSSIWKQFPMAGFFRYTISDACPNKVTLCKGNVEISNGQHYAIFGGQTTWRWQGWNHPLMYPVEKNFTQVHHFKWDSTAGERLKAVADINQAYSFSDEYKIMYNYLKTNNFVIDISNKNFMFENIPLCGYEYYRNWKLLTKKIIKI